MQKKKRRTSYHSQSGYCTLCGGIGSVPKHHCRTHTNVQTARATQPEEMRHRRAQYVQDLDRVIDLEESVWAGDWYEFAFESLELTENDPGPLRVPLAAFLRAA